MHSLFVQGRHVHISVIVISQSWSGHSGIHPTIRKNSDLIIHFYIRSIDDRKNIANQFINVDNDVKKGMNIINNITHEQYTSCCIMCNKTDARTLTDYVYKVFLTSKLFPNPLKHADPNFGT